MSLRLSEPPVARRTRTFLRRWERGSFRAFLEEYPLPSGGPVVLLDPKGRELASLRAGGTTAAEKKELSFGTPPVASLVGDVDTLPNEFIGWLRVLMGTLGACKNEVDSLSDHALERHRELNLLYGFTERSTSLLTVDDLLSLVLTNAIHAVQASGASLQLMDATNASQQMSRGTVPSLSQHILDRVREESTPMVGMLPESLRPAKGDRWSGALVCLPLRTAGKSIGTLLVAAGEGRMLQASDERILTALATLAATRIEQARLQAEATRKRELAAVGHMASAIVHDFKNPLTAIRGFAEMIAIGAAAPEEYPELANQVVSNADRLWSMVDELLHFVRGSAQSLQLREVSGREYAEHLQTILAPAIPGCIELAIDLNKIESFTIDRDKFDRVIVNLVRNAVEAIVGTGHIRVVGSIHKDNPERIQIEISDDGPGIPKQAREHLFEAFFTTGKANGTGLGLAIVRKIVDDHGGRISFDSQLGKGSRFLIELAESPVERVGT